MRLCSPEHGAIETHCVGKREKCLGLDRVLHIEHGMRPGIYRYNPVDPGNSATIHWQEPRQAKQQSGLSCAIRPDDTDDGILGNFEANLLKRPNISIALR